MEILNGKGNDKFTAYHYTAFTVLATGPYSIIIDDEIQQPAKIYYVNKDSLVEISCDKSVRHTMKLSTIQSRGEVNSGEKLVEVIDDSELSMEDRIKASLMAQMSQLAENQGLDSFEDDNDFDDDFDEDPLSSYETKEMVEEYLAINDLTVDETGKISEKNPAPQVLKETDTTSQSAVSTSEANSVQTTDSDVSNPADK